MTYGSIDIGTNAVLLLIMEDRNRGLKELLDTSTITRLGEGVLQHGRLAPAAMERTVKALETYRKLLDEHHAAHIACFGTSALREAHNRDDFIDMVHARTSLKVRVISEYEEAYYTYLSVKDDPGIAGDSLAIIDIGGGSTEITLGDRERFSSYVSLPVGTVKLTELFVKHDPPLPEELRSLAAFVREKIPRNQVKGAPTIVGMAGTVTTLAAMVLGLAKFSKEKIHGLTITMQTLTEWIERLSRMTVAERKTLPGMEPGREDLLLQGMILMREIVSSFRATHFAVSTHGARYGVIYEALGK
jgi:exopolyphosphatase/guanosine-5'-triphosphate,3'-diphosphate pyrophosphatase